MFAVTFRGDGVFGKCSIFGIIHDTTENTLEEVKRRIKLENDIEVYDFHTCHGVLSAFTDLDNVMVYIEETQIIIR